MKVVIAGASGLVGSALSRYLQQIGHQVISLVRSKDKIDESAIYWNPYQDELESLEGVDAVVNFSGENISTGRWTPEKKKRILDSRIFTTRTLVHAMKKMEKKPEVFINASAIGYYGGDHLGQFDENSPVGKGFLATVCQKWETEALEAKKLGIRTCCLRIGMVVSSNGGALKKMLLPFKLGLGGVLGSGNQMMSWIAIEDLVSVVFHLLTESQVEGAINAVSPYPVSNRQFTKLLGKALRRPTILPMPSFMVKLLFGEMGEEILLRSSRVVPLVLQQEEFHFDFPHLEKVFKEL